MPKPFTKKILNTLTLKKILGAWVSRGNAFYMPWNIELSNDNLKINSGEVQIDLIRYLD